MTNEETIIEKPVKYIVTIELKDGEKIAFETVTQKLENIQSFFLALTYVNGTIIYLPISDIKRITQVPSNESIKRLYQAGLGDTTSED